MSFDMNTDTSILHSGMDDAVAETIEFGRRKYDEASWEDLVRGGRGLKGIIACLSLPVRDARRQEILNAAARALRIKFPKLTNDGRYWKSQQDCWTNELAFEIVEVVRETIEERLLAPPPVPPLMPSMSPETLELLRSLPALTWAPWQLFVTRQVIPSLSGLYIFGRFKALPTAPVDPLDPDVVYIGKTDHRLIPQRLYEFNSSWLGGTGHRGGFRLRNQLLLDFEVEVLFGHTLFVSWMWFPEGEIGHIGVREEELLRSYRSQHGRYPLANKRG